MTRSPDAGTWARISKAAALDRRLSSATLHVLVVLGCYADATGHCYPSIATIAIRLGLKERVVRYHLRRLEQLGYLITTRRQRPRGALGRRANGARLGGGWAPNAYQLIFPTPPSLAADDSGQPAIPLHIVQTDNLQSDDTDNLQSHCR